MTHFTVHSLESAPAGSRPMLEGIKNTFGFVPNLYAAIAESPAALQGALAIGEAYSKSSLSPAEQQLVALAVSEVNGCQFCVAAHSLIAKHMAKADPAHVAAVRNGEPLTDARLNALITFVRKVTEQRGLVAETDLAAFLKAGYSKAQVMEVLLSVGMKTFNNYVAHITEIPLNDQLKAEAWTPNKKVA